jgi:predicted RecB family nuclease
MNKGNQFELKIVKYINDNVLKIETISSYITKETCNKTIELMNKGIPIIHSAPFYNKTNKTKGVIDLLIRSDYINKIVKTNVLETNEIKTSLKSYYYIVIDIKFSTIPLMSDGIHIQNSSNYKAYKSQLCIYTEAIGHIQNYHSKYAFILGRRCKYTKNSIVYNNHNCLERLGRIDYDKIDNIYITHTKNAINWLRDVRKNHHIWTINPPSNVNLYPNMCIDSGIWNVQKENISNEIGELTCIWNVNISHRENAFKKGIKKWQDKKCNSKILGIKGKRSDIIDKILNINRQNVHKILPLKIENNIYNWKYNKNEIFVDFETISDIITDFDNLPNQKSSELIFLIGIYHRNDENNWEYTKFVCKNMSQNEEKHIINEFINFLKIKKYPVINYWFAEQSLWKRACYRNNVDNSKINKWVDLYHIFKSEPIVIKDCFNFGLKSIYKAMKKHNLIDIKMDSLCMSGKSAMIRAIDYYEQKCENNDIMNDICLYNKFDCKVLKEILYYLRKNHI